MRRRQIGSYQVTVSILRRLFGPGQPDPREALRPLYQQVVAHARQPHWYLQGGVPDSIDGRFEMVSALLALTLIRLESDPSQAAAMAFLTEIFVDDMDAQLREFGVGDMVVGKRVGRLMGAFGGRLGAYREALADGTDNGMLAAAIRRNLYTDANPAADQIDHVVAGMRRLSAQLALCDASTLVAGGCEW